MICYLVRHGKDDDSVRGGWSASPLTDEGILQVNQLANMLVSTKSLNIGKLFSSDLLRAKQTADILSAALKLPVTELPEFRETNNGVLAGMDNLIASELYPGLYWSSLQWDQPYPEGESPRAFYERISNAWYTFKKKHKNQDCNVMLVTHGGVINVIQCIENNTEYTNKTNPYPLGNAEIVSIEI